jgi:hypothetical protein
LEKAKKNLVFHFEGGRHTCFPQKPVVKSLCITDFCQSFQMFPLQCTGLPRDGGIVLRVAAYCFEGSSKMRRKHNTEKQEEDFFSNFRIFSNATLEIGWSYCVGYTMVGG